MVNTISVDKSTFSRLKNEYQKAVNNSKNTFMFDGNELLTGYAKYLVEYLKNKFE